MSKGIAEQRKALRLALNDFVGVLATYAEIKQRWRYHGGTFRFDELFDQYLDRASQNIQVIYDREPGWYTKVYFRVKQKM